MLDYNLIQRRTNLFLSNIKIPQMLEEYKRTNQDARYAVLVHHYTTKACTPDLTPIDFLETIRVTLKSDDLNSAVVIHLTENYTLEEEMIEDWERMIREMIDSHVQITSTQFKPAYAW